MSFREPLHVFAIPPSVADHLAPRASPATLIDTTPPRSPSPTQSPEYNQSAPSGSLACALCLGASFPDVNEQRAHFRSDWHRYNVKARLQDANARPVAEAQFATLVDGLEESLSGSASSSSDESEDSKSGDAVSTLLHRKQKNRLRSVSPTSQPTIARNPVVWFQAPNIPNTQFGVYSTLFPSSTPVTSYSNALRNLQDGGPDGRRWALFMTAGGHFAGMIVRVSKPGPNTEFQEPALTKSGKKAKNKPNQPDYEVLAHKTFHRYTTRRKQGGSQSTNDNAKGNAKSAGAQLRRYGEQALRDDIRGLLMEWIEDLDACERIFIRASVSNRNTFIGYEGAPIQKGDDRLRTFPFPTRRPTLAELTRCLNELTRVKISHLSEEALQAMDAAFLDSLPKPKLVPTPSLQPPKPPSDTKKPPKLTAEEEALRDKWRRLLEMVQKGRLDTLKTFWERESGALGGIDTSIPDWLREEEKRGLGGTLLQVASASGQEEVTRWLLEDLRANPTIPVPTTYVSSNLPEDEGGSDAEAPASAPSKGRTAYDLASTRPVRNVFRRCAYAYPDLWDWLGDAHVPSVLSPEMEENQDQKKGVRRKGLKERAKEREEAAKIKAKADEEAAAKKKAEAEKSKTKLEGASRKTGPQKLGGASTSGGGGVVANAGLGAMTPEMRAKIERERRARAAEARLKGPSA